MYVGSVKLSVRLSVSAYMDAIIGYLIIGKTLYQYITSTCIYMYYMYVHVCTCMYIYVHVHVCTCMSSFDHTSLPTLLTLLALKLLKILLVLKLLVLVSVSSVVGRVDLTLYLCWKTMDNLIRLFRPIGSHQHGVSQIQNTPNSELFP